MQNIHTIQNAIKKRVLVLDGAMGSILQRHKHSDNNDMLALYKPEIIAYIHELYLRAGADIIETNTFNSNAISQAEYNTQSKVYEMNRAAAIIARQCANKYATPNKPRFIAGSIGPTNKSLSMSDDVYKPEKRAITFAQLADAYYEQATGLLDGGIDLFLIETVFDTLNAKAALFGINKALDQKQITNFPISISITVNDDDGRMLTGQTLDAFVTSVSDYDLFSIGINCSFGAEKLIEHIRTISQISNLYISAYPNAGLPNQLGQYDETPHQMACCIHHYLDEQLVNIIGGCCGTTHEHIAEIATLAQKAKPHIPPSRIANTAFSGLNNLSINHNFIKVGERANVAGSRKFARLIAEKKYDEALHIVRQQITAGAQIIDINMDDAMLNAKDEITTFINLIASEPEIAAVPVMIDSSSSDVHIAALQCLQGKSIVNSINLKEGEETFLNNANIIRQYGAAVVVMAADEQGQATTLQRKIDICKRAYELLTQKINFNPNNIIFDPNILTIATGMSEHNNYAVDFIDATKWIKKNLPHSLVSGGVSNLSFAFRGNNYLREAMHSVFLHHAIPAGLDMAIVNPNTLVNYDNIAPEFRNAIEDVVLNRTPNATETLIALSQSVQNNSADKNTATNNETPKWRNLSLSKRISYGVTYGIDDFINEDINAAISEYPTAIGIIEGPLMEGMNTTGELFGEGKMFLPQVIKTARVMKKAVDILQPILEEQNANTANTKAGRIVLATVKGDVHDIGKNIVGIILTCNNYEVIDLGVMVDANVIVQTAIQQNADAIGISGLISPSLDEMRKVAIEMEAQKMSIPLLIGGATTSSIHTAVKLAPNYSGPIIHVLDAAKAPSVLSSLLSEGRDEFVNSTYDHYENLRNSVEFKPKNANAPQAAIPALSAPIKPKVLGITTFTQYPIQDLIPLINWKAFYHAWKIDDTTEQGKDEQTKLRNDAMAMLTNICKENTLTANAVVGLFPANSNEDNILIFSPTNPDEKIGEIQLVRSASNKCYADYIAPEGSGSKDYIGLFAATAGIGIEQEVARYKGNDDDYSALMLELIAARLTEAFSIQLHYKVRTELWGYSDETLDINGKNGIRPAFGYPNVSEHHVKQIAFNLLNAKSIGLSLTENYAMLPVASVCGMYFTQNNY
ncbi:MAG: methionine synthase [Ignavibacteria bacterium]|jgi:5-methyltetrahydrofolate--homocysteine methyltransferase|nr:methionine synthase [Ignavibacteria bacterium]